MSFVLLSLYLLYTVLYDSRYWNDDNIFKE